MPACARVLAPAFADKVETIVGDMGRAMAIIPAVMELMQGEVWTAEASRTPHRTPYMGDVHPENEEPSGRGIEHGEVPGGRIVGAIVITVKEPRFLLGSLWLCLRTMGPVRTMRAFSMIRDYMKSAPRRLEGEGILEAVGVPVEWRGKGIGAALVTAAEEHLRESGQRYFGLGVKSDSPAVRLYEKLGFERKNEYSNRLGHWVYMRKGL